MVAWMDDNQSNALEICITGLELAFGLVYCHVYLYAWKETGNFV